MKQKFNFATWWRYISRRNFYTLTTKMAPPGGEIYFLFHTNNTKFPPHANFFRISLISYECSVLEVLRGPKKTIKN